MKEERYKYLDSTDDVHICLFVVKPSKLYPILWWNPASYTLYCLVEQRSGMMKLFSHY